MIDHVKVFATDAETSRRFYEAALEPLGYRVLMETAPGVVGMGARFPFFWISPLNPDGGQPTVCHLAFRAESNELVDAFHAAALAAGGRDNGPPGERPQYHPGYYGAFVLDPDGNNAEAVCHNF